jgi:hypothetical protein
MTQTEEDTITMEQAKKRMDTSNGVAFDWGLAGPGGAWFVLFREAHHTDADIEGAKIQLHRDRDVVSIRVRSIK